MTAVRVAFLCAMLIPPTAGPALAVEVLGVSTNTARGNDLLNMASACHAQFASGARVCQSEDIMRATAIGTLPDYGTNSVPVVLYLQPSIKGATPEGNGNSGARSMDAIGASASAFTTPQCVVMQRFVNLLAEPVNTFDLTTSCSTQRQVVCCLD